MFSNQTDRYQIAQILLSREDNISLEDKVQMLTELVFELLREVEALRAAQINQAESQGIAPKESDYGKAYVNTALLTHNSAGPSGGLDKLLALWFGWTNQHIPRTHRRFLAREVLILKRLGFTEQEITEYIKTAENFERRT